MTETFAARHNGDRLLDVVVEILETEGYDAVQLREVARRAQSSLATIYKRYPTRDDLILAALEYWSKLHRYAGITVGGGLEASLYDGLMQIFRTIFEPWESHPEMLAAYFRVRSSPNGQKLFRFGLDLVAPAGLEVLAGVDDEFIANLDAIFSSVIYGLLGRFSAGEIAATDILPVLERTVYWLTLGYESAPPRRSSASIKRRSNSGG
ncbi:TetR/AcrR family transcriptional regulator [Mycolicibacterium parafortuitum]|uniref:TetR family transcriptional regulator [Frankia sp. EAN1pec] n=1 Tax=Mycolicibacterium parafortuitum TaxID=39692 RepID=A0A375YK27_MYCPF|nr:TetR/AcrR family transcriptional regulator [Mycolicibacterium parafortuitum]ORB23570.1 TetR family transcriptional regulator [Mycolicibacterium parafortuitum]SRX81507.1 TetR family transcriptional regulator [Frankia sp. EAN1pec] [Mycolicibacterium parafortuitum]